MKNINPKLRFQILNRDSYECKYCGLKAGNGIQLQVDHIIPKSKGGTNELRNLITSCYECNIGKGANKIVDIEKDIYKTKIKENTFKHLMMFYEWWNSRDLGTIDNNTKSLLNIYYSIFLSDNNYSTYLDYPAVHKGKIVSKNLSELQLEFKLGGDFCDRVLSVMDGPHGTCLINKNNKDEVFREMDDFLGSILNNDIWNGECKDNYNYRLNYDLSTTLYDLCIEGEVKNDYSIQKFSYFYNEIKGAY